MKPCTCSKCGNYVKRYNKCLKGHRIDYMRYWQDGCKHYSEIVHREIPRETYENTCHKCEHSEMCDLTIQGIPYCNIRIQDCQGVITVKDVEE